MNSSSSLPSLNTFLATVTAGLTGTLVYHYLKSKFCEENEDAKKSWDAILHVDVPRDSVAHLIGRNGMNIRQIEEETFTSISFIDSGGPCRMAVLRGTKDGVKLAKEKLVKSVEECAQLETSEICVSERTIARLTAEESLKLRDIAFVSKAKIYIDGQNLLVRGTYHQIEKVRECLKEMVTEEKSSEIETIRNCTAACSPSSPKKKLPALSLLVENERLEPTSSDGYCEVMISAVESPSKFFVQKAGLLSKELDCLTENITDFYSNEENRLQYAASKYSAGSLVAVLIPDDKCWYRARVVSDSELDEENIDESILLVDILDFGDRLPTKQRYVANLNPDFLTMQFQSIECTLANVKPIESGEWTYKAIEAFETLTYCVQWKIMMARVASVVNIDGRRAFSVKLVDTNNEKDVDIATELVRLGYATLTE